MNTLAQIDNSKITQALELEYTYSSNGWKEIPFLEQTDLVINEGQTISGKSMREHLEAINHQEAIVFIKIVLKRMSFLVKKKSFPCILSFYDFT
jgi:hypothetical protein